MNNNPTGKNQYSGGAQGKQKPARLQVRNRIAQRIKAGRAIARTSGSKEGMINNMVTFAPLRGSANRQVFRGIVSIVKRRSGK